MLKNFFKTSIRSLLRNKTYSALNILGLAIGVACTGLIFLWVEDEVNYDEVNVKKDKLYLVLNNWPFAQHFSTYDNTPGPLGPAIKAEIPGIANTCRYTDGPSKELITIGDKKMYAEGEYADSSIFSMLTLPFVQGNAAGAFKQLYSIVITESTAKKFFGNEKNVIGKIVKIDNRDDYTVSGVIKDFPENTSLKFEWVAPYEVYFKENQWLKNWGANSLLTLVELKDNTQFTPVSRQLEGFIRKKQPGSIASSILFNMNDWHLRFDFENGKQTGKGRIQYVRMFTLIAWIILFLACINFMNLATARSEKRAKEVGVRKVLGSGKSKLITQFIGEALFMSLLSVIVAVVIIVTVLPAFNTLAQKNLTLGLNNPYHLLALAAITVLCGLIAGSYPSLYLSSFNPVAVLKGLKLKAGSAGFIRKGLVVLQFTVSIVLIISTVIIFQQIQHIKNRDLGFDKKNLMVLPLQGDMGKNYPGIKQHLLNTGVVEITALTDRQTLYGGNNRDSYTWKGKDGKSKVIISNRGITPEFLTTNGIKIMQGRDFNADASTDTTNIIINETLAKIMGRKNVLGEYIYEDSTKYKIVGITQDFVYGDMYGQPDPLIFFCQNHNEYENTMYIRLKKQADVEKAVAKIGDVIKKDNPAFPFNYRFVDDQFNQMFQSEMLVSKLSRIFASLAIVISCLGLFGLAAYTAERRTKEIGIRKVLGASITGLASLLTVEFVKLVILSTLLAFPVAWYAMYKWLENYAYHVGIQWWVFAAAGMAALLIAVITISFQAIKAALMNPVKAIKAK